MLTASACDSGHWIERARVQLAGLRDDDGGPFALSQCRSERGCVHLPVSVRGNARGSLAEAQIPQSCRNSRVRVFAEEHSHARRTGKPFGFHVPTRPCQHRAARGREANEARHRGAGDEADGAFPRQPQDVEQPSCGNLFRHCSRG